jgi:hypothetical protein
MIVNTLTCELMEASTNPVSAQVQKIYASYREAAKSGFETKSHAERKKLFEDALDSLLTEAGDAGITAEEITAVLTNSAGYARMYAPKK